MGERLDAADPATGARVADALRAGHLAVLPTESTYALVADAFQPLATARLFGAKRSGRDVPLPVVIRSPRQVNGLVAEVPEAAERLMASYWPGPLTLVFSESDGLSWDLGVTQGTVALRLPPVDLLLSVVADVGPLACTAACQRGEPPPRTIAEAQTQLGLTVELYVDGGPLEGPASTVVDVTRGGATVLRVGAIPAAHVEAVASGAVGWGARPVDAPAGGDAPEPVDAEQER